jgi:poly-gamma-glutamate capsule biosynthesis protein CapA/YwtB (metallophosphatase superfamily)
MKYKRKYARDPIMAEIEGVKEKHDPVCTPESEAKIKAKLAAGMTLPLFQTAKFQAAPPTLKKQMMGAAHARRLRTLHNIWNPEDEP